MFDLAWNAPLPLSKIDKIMMPVPTSAVPIAFEFISSTSRPLPLAAPAAFGVSRRTEHRIGTAYVGRERPAFPTAAGTQFRPLRDYEAPRETGRSFSITDGRSTTFSNRRFTAPEYARLAGPSRWR
ncbi:hypothetical protein GCM10009102_29500 [Sphingomonas insulae]|uniref:Uncharacterized protein n=1 Tax=Sphingomonas insulae TaxID=424800 RepID=A0ABP3TAR4_9SPHN